MRKFALVLLMVALTFSCNEAFAIDMKAITDDVHLGDKDFPPTMSAPVFQVKGSNLYGIIYIAEGKGPHPTAFIFHGFPGNEKTLDLAQALRRGGINTIFFGFRGAWGSEGNFSYKNCIEDAMAAIDFYKTPEISQKFRIDPENLIVMGHSMGGFVTLNVARQRKDIRAYVFLSGWNIGYVAETLSKATPEELTSFKQFLSASGVPLKGTNSELLLEEILSMKDTHNLVSYVPDLKGKKIFMVTATNDAPCPTEYHHKPLYDALKKVSPDDVAEITLDTDHAYSGVRTEMIRGVFNWLQSIGY